MKLAQNWAVVEPCGLVQINRGKGHVIPELNLCIQFRHCSIGSRSPCQPTGPDISKTKGTASTNSVQFPESWKVLNSHMLISPVRSNGKSCRASLNIRLKIDGIHDLKRSREDQNRQDVAREGRQLSGYLLDFSRVRFMISLGKPA